MSDVVSRVSTEQQIQQCFNVMKFLRPHLNDISEQDFVEKVQRQYQQGYRIACIMEGDKAVSLVGYRMMEFMAWGKVLYIDDLITHPDTKRKGYAGRLLDWVFDLAKEEACDEVHLDTGHHRFDAHRLYLNKGMQIVSHHLSKVVE